MAPATKDAFARNEDGTAVDPRAFQKAIREDPVRLEEASKDPEVAKVLLGEDMNALQELLRSYHLVRPPNKRRPPSSRAPPPARKTPA